MKLFVAIYDDARLFGHFLRHYAKAGMTDFFVALGEEVAGVTATAPCSTRITYVRGLDVADSFYGGNAAVTQMRRRYQDPNEWAIIVDLDEFIEFPVSISEIVKAAERQGANVVKGTKSVQF